MFLPLYFLKNLQTLLKYYIINIDYFGKEGRSRTVEFSVRKIKYEILSSSSQSKTATVFENWITITFFRENLQVSIS
jgi:hypothetical protein